MPQSRILRLVGLGLLTAVVAVVVIFALRSFGGAREADAGDAPLFAPVRTKMVDGQMHVIIEAKDRATSGIVTVRLSTTNYQGEASGLATVVSPQTLAEQARAYQQASADAAHGGVNVKAAQLEVDRLQPLHKADRIVSDKALETAENTLATEQANLKVATAQLQTQQATLQEQWGPVLGPWLTSNPPDLARLLGGQDLLLQIALPADQPVSNPATAKIEVAPNATLSAHIISAVPQADPKFQGQSFYAVMPADPHVRPGMTLPGTVPSGPSQTGVVIPENAVVRTGSKSWAYVQEADGSFVRHRVDTLSRAGDGWLQQANGFAAGSAVVVRGAQLLLSEEIKADPGARGSE